MVDLFKALAEESRLRILAMLLQDEMCVCEIEAGLKMTQSNVSRHLTALKNGGIVESYKKAQWVYYKISDRFKTENQNLWLYLESKLQSLPSYQIDAEAFQNSNRQDLCTTRLPQFSKDI